MPGVLLIYQAHQEQIELTLALGLVVEAGTRQTQQLTLPPDADRGMVWLYQPPFLLNGAVPLFFLRRQSCLE
jgi:hypothetical protein